MTEWKCDPYALQPVLTETGTASESLATIITEESIAAIFSGLSWGGQITACVGEALSEVLRDQQEVNLATVANHISAGVNGVGNAARALNTGNEDMAGSFHSAMFTAADTGDFTYFEQHGYRGE